MLLSLGVGRDSRVGYSHREVLEEFLTALRTIEQPIHRRRHLRLIPGEALVCKTSF